MDLILSWYVPTLILVAYMLVRLSQSFDEREDAYLALWNDWYHDPHFPIEELLTFKMYWKHLWLRLTFRDPWVIYSDKLREKICNDWFMF